MKLLTDIELAEKLQAFKAKKEQQKQREREQKKKQLKEKQSQLKRVEKLKKELYVQQLINTHVKPFQKPPEPLKHIPIINIGDFDEETLYNLDELIHIEELYPNENGRLNWKFFEELVEKVRKEMTILS